MLKIQLSIALFHKRETCELTGRDAVYILESLRKAPDDKGLNRPFVCITGYSGMSIQILEESFEDFPSYMTLMQGIAYNGSNKNSCWSIANKKLETEQINFFINQWHNRPAKVLPNKHLYQSSTIDTQRLLAAYSISSSYLTPATRFIPAPVYEPELWNDNIQLLANNNCYTYALNVKSLRKSCGKDPNKTSLGDIVKNCLADGLHISTTVTHTCPTHTIALFASLPFSDIAKTRTDYHFFRRDAHGGWSHKNGHSNVTNRDFSGNIIQDIMACDRGRFKHFFCLFHVSAGAIKKVSERV